MAEPETSISRWPLVVRSHVTAWGFLVALPMAFAFAALGALSLDALVTSGSLGRLEASPLWLFSVPLVGFGLFLFLVGVSELARYVKPSVEVVLDEQGITTRGLVAGRHIAWGDLVEVRIEPGQIALTGRSNGGRAVRTARLHLGRLEVDPVELMAAITTFRPDLRPVYSKS
ncbi:MAG: PH domain-containing protein [Hyphomicrobiaceae bacterium]